MIQYFQKSEADLRGSCVIITKILNSKTNIFKVLININVIQLNGVFVRTQFVFYSLFFKESFVFLK